MISPRDGPYVECIPWYTLDGHIFGEYKEREQKRSTCSQIVVVVPMEEGPKAYILVLSTSIVCVYIWQYKVVGKSNAKEKGRGPPFEFHM